MKRPSKKTHGLGTVITVAAFLAVPLTGCAESAQPPSASESSEGSSPARLLVGKPFEDALNQSVSISWQERRLRSGLNQLAEAREVALLLDRRIDPEQALTLGLSRIPLRDVLRTIATECDAGLSIVGSTIYIGPPETAGKLRTIVELRSGQIAGANSVADTKRCFQLLRRSHLSWQDLDRPVDIVASVCREAELQMTISSDVAENPGQKASPIPHDLWASGTVPGSTVTEKLTLLLAQFDLSFEWQPGASSIQLVSMPKQPTVARTWSISRSKRTRITELLPQLRHYNVQVNGARLTATATVEQLEELDRLLYPERYPNSATPRSPQGDLRFTFEIRAQLGSLLKALPEKSDIRFNYNEDTLKSAGVDLTRGIDMKMNNATLPELCKALFKDSGIVWKIDGNTVTLSSEK